MERRAMLPFRIAASLLLLCGPLPTLAAVGVTPVTSEVTRFGEAQLSIPIVVPPGVGGVQPNLALSYRHRTLSTLLGRGWSIAGLSAITRCGKTWAQDGAMTAVRNEIADQYCLDGNKLRITSGVHGQGTAVYQLEYETFAKITTTMNANGTGPASFEVMTKDGLIYEYGTTADSRIESLGTGMAHTWLLNRVRDRSNNRMTYTYIEDANGAARISSIVYTIAGNPGVPAPNEVLFVWEAKPAGDTEVRYLAGQPITETQRLDRVDIKVNTVVVRRYELTYEASLSPSSHSRLASIQECAGPPLDCLPATSFSYLNRPVGVSTQEGASITMPDSVQAGHSMDINNDGRADVLYRSVDGGGTWMYALAAGDAGSFDTPVNTNIAAPPSGEIIMDYDWDRGPDVLYPQGGTWWVMRNNTVGFLTPTNTNVPVEHATAVGSNARGLDINGDGREDLVWAMTNQTGTNAIRYKLREGAGTFSAQTFTLYGPLTSGAITSPFTSLDVAARPPDFDGDGRRDLVFVSSEPSRRVNVISPAGYSFFTPIQAGTTAVWGDFNGDGYSDLLYHGPSGRFVVYGSGTLFTAPVPVPQLPNILQYNGPCAVIDYDGDGRDDVLMSDPQQANWYLLKSTPTGFAAPVDTGYIKRTQAQVADVNGDGFMDLAYNQGARWTVRVQGPSNPTLPGDLLSSATDSYGNSYSFDYRTLTDPNVYTNVEGTNLPLQAVRTGVNVVYQQRVPSGISGTQEVITHKYEDVRFEPQRRIFLGFETVNRTYSLSGLYRSSTYAITWPFLGLLTREETRLANATGPLVDSISNLINFVTLGAGFTQRSYAFNSRLTRAEYEIGAAAGLKRTTETDVVMDNNTGTVRSEHTVITEGSTANGVQPAARYQIDRDNTQIFTDDVAWCIGRPATTVITAQHDQFAGEVQTRRVDTSWDSTHCRPTQRVRDPLVPAQTITETYGYDDDAGDTQPDFGQLTRITVSAPGQANRVSRYVWSDKGQFPIQVFNALDEKTEFTWDIVVGQVASITDPNLVRTNYTYDGFGRRLRETRPDGTYTTWLYQACAALGCVNTDNRLAITQEEHDTTTATITDSTVFLDTLGRTIAAREKLLSGAYNRRDWQFNTKGELYRNSFPCTWTTAAATCTLWRTYIYDELSRPHFILQPTSDDGTGITEWTFTYQGLTTTTSDPTGTDRVTVKNVMGSLLQGRDPGLNVVNYDYDAFGRVRRIRDTNGTVLRTYTYNQVGYLTNTSDVNEGNWIYAPDSLGQLTSRTDANGKALLFSYDPLGRLRTIQMPEGAGSITRTFTYGSSSAAHNIGKLEWQETAGQGVATYRQNSFYDAQGRLTRATHVEGGNTHEFLYDYNATTGFLDKITYPVSTGTYRFHVRYEYQNGLLQRVFNADMPESFWRAQAANVRGDVTLERLGDEANGVTLDINSTIDVVTGLMKARTSTFSSGALNGTNLTNLGYLYDGAGNLTQRQDNRQGLTEDFYYDIMDRLDKTQRSTGQIIGDYGYDGLGNITSNSRLGTYSYTATVPGCTYYAHPQIHAVRQVTSGTTTYNYCYDANGNMTNRNGTAIAWYADNMPKSVVKDANNSSTFEYDAAGMRWKHVYKSAGVTYTQTYLSPLLERVQAPTTTDWKHFIFVNGESIGMYLRGTDGEKGRFFLTKDHQGGVAALTQMNGSSYMVRESFQAFGERRGVAWSNAPTAWELTQMEDRLRRGFTMHEHLDSTGLIHMNGRMYDPLLARFISPDPLVSDPSNPQAHNRYSYVYNNPGSFTDPSGYGNPRTDPHTPDGGPEFRGDWLSFWGRDWLRANGAVGGRGGSPGGARQGMQVDGGTMLNSAITFGTTTAESFSVWSVVGISTADAEPLGPRMQPRSRMTRLEQFGVALSVQVRLGNITELEAGARLADRAATLYYDPNQGRGDQDIAGFIDALAQVGGGLNTITLQRNNPRLVRFSGTSGFAADLQDTSRQVEHFFASMDASYVGEAFGLFFMNHREHLPRDIADVRLNRIAFVAAWQLRNRVLDMRDLDDFMRNELGPK